MTAIQKFGPVSLTWIEGKGRGVVANRDLATGEEPVHSPVVVIPAKQAIHAAKTVLNNYVFHWPFDADGNSDENGEAAAMACGLGCMLNHSDDANCDWTFNGPNLIHTIRVVQPIASGDELTINYGWDPDNREQLVESRVNHTIVRPHGNHQLVASEQLRLRPLRGGNLLIHRNGKQIALSHSELSALRPILRPGLIRRLACP